MTIDTSTTGLPETTQDKAGGLSFADYVQIVGGAKDLPDSEVDAAVMMAQILSAASLEDGLGERNAEAIRDHIGEEFILHDFRLNRSDQKYEGQGSPVYAVLDVTFTATGERVALTTGSTFVLSALGLVLKLNQWDEHFTTKAIDVKNGTAIKMIYLPTVTTSDGTAF